MGIEGGCVVFNTKVGKDHSLAVLPANYDYDWAQAWTRLKQVLDMTEEEFNAEAEAISDGEDSGDSNWSLDSTDGGEGDNEDEELDGETGDEEDS